MFGSRRAVTLAALCVVSFILRFAPPLRAAPFLRDPDIHGENVVFNCEGDLWLGDLRTGKAVRLTSHEGVESNGRFSPDGGAIAFTGQYDDTAEVYTIPVAGGTPRRVTYLEGMTAVGWTPDGRRIVCRKNWPFFGRTTYLSTVPATGGIAEKLPLEFADLASFAPDGRRFVFTRISRRGEGWFGYRGGMKNDIWAGDSVAKTFRKIYSSDGTNEYPVWAGDRVFWVRDDGGQFSVVSARPDGGDIRRVAGPYRVEVRNLHSDGKRLIYEKGFGLEIAEIATGKTREITFDLASDLRYTRPVLVPARDYVDSVSIGPSGRRVLIGTRGQIVSLPAKEGDARVILAVDGARLRQPAYSPNGKRIAYLSDATKENQLYVADADGSHPKQLTHDSNRHLAKLRWSPDGKWIALTDSRPDLRLVAADGSRELRIGRSIGTEGPLCDFSPDSKWLAYSEATAPKNFSFLVLYDIANQRETRLGGGMMDDFAPAFSRDGKYLCFLSNRSVRVQWDSFLSQLDTGAPTRAYLLVLRKDGRSPFLPAADDEAAPPETPAAAFQLDADGLYDRIVELPLAPNRWNDIEAVGDRVYVSNGGGMEYYDLKAKRSGVVPNAANFEISADGKKTLLQNAAGWRVADAATLENSANEPNVNFGGLTLQINPSREWEQMYWEGWRLLRDYFYVANMHGADWPAIGQKYARHLPDLRSRDELNQLLRWMEAELSVGHTYVGGGDGRSLARPGKAAYLGVDLEPDAGGFMKITHIFRGDGFDMAERSPFAETGLNVREGQYLVEAAGVPVRDDMAFQQRLLNRAGEVITVKVNDRPILEGARSIPIKLAASEGRMRYVDWVARNREYVAKASGGKIGYLHLQAMGEKDMEDFIRQYYALRDKSALLVDTRFNGGGNISGQVLNVLFSRAAFHFSFRNNPPNPARQESEFTGPLACVTNEYAGSDGDLFPYQFRAYHLGPLIGRRGWGGVVGPAPTWNLVDGGVIWVPRYGAFTQEKGWIIEGHGVDMDYDVESDPNAYVRGVDPQLDKGIAYLLDQIGKHPQRPLSEPPAPVKIVPAKPGRQQTQAE